MTRSSYHVIQADINQSKLRGGQMLPRIVLGKVLKSISKQLGLKKRVRISIAFVGSKEMRKLNREFRGKDKVTDVLSFPLESETYLGEVLICYDQAREQAKESGHSIRYEVIFLLVHGILHVFGYDHETEKDKKIMFETQDRIMASS